MTKTISGHMIDTETLALGPRALIWELACVPFTITLEKGVSDVAIDMGDPLHVTLDYAASGTRGFDIDFRTLEFTRDKRGGDPIWETWNAACMNGKPASGDPEIACVAPVDLVDAIFQSTGDGHPVWFRNSAFDVPAIEHLVSSFGLRMPWHRRQQSDIYTMINLAKQLHGFEDTLPATTGHRAVDDAKGQIMQLAELLWILQNGSTHKS